MSAATPLPDAAQTPSPTEASTPYLVWASVAAGVAMSVAWLFWGAQDTYLTTVFYPTLAFVAAFVVAQVRRDKDAARELGIVLVAVIVLMIFGAVVVLPLPWAVVTIAFLFAGAASRNLALVILGLASGIGVALNAWPSAYADAGPGLSIGALSPVIGAAAILVARAVVARRAATPSD
ncbi:hypothetical protein [Demequina aurantiaca]|uniref:hypothetical protein n=1 Tax=Demequina aurantiaca TaxID=676200 RepID=UPI003D334238